MSRTRWSGCQVDAAKTRGQKLMEISARTTAHFARRDGPHAAPALNALPRLYIDKHGIRFPLNRKGAPMTAAQDFNTMDHGEIAQFLQDRLEEFGEGPDPQKAKSVTAAFNSGHSQLIRRSYGFAVVTKRPEQNVLWYLYVAPQHRGKGGPSRTFVQEIVDALGGSCILLCYGIKRRDFFLRCGFQQHPNERGGFAMGYPTI